MVETYYPTAKQIIEFNQLILARIRVRKADKAHVLDRAKLSDILMAAKEFDGDIYDKAAVLLTRLIKGHPFASGNRRTAFVVTKDFLFHNNATFGIADDPEQARILLGIREGFYTHEEIKEWIKHGKIRPFKR